MPKSLRKLESEYVKANTASAIQIVKVPPMKLKPLDAGKSVDNTNRSGWTKNLERDDSLAEKSVEVKLAKQVLGQIPKYF